MFWSLSITKMCLYHCIGDFVWFSIVLIPLLTPCLIMAPYSGNKRYNSYALWYFSFFFTLENDFNVCKLNAFFFTTLAVNVCYCKRTRVYCKLTFFNVPFVLMFTVFCLFTFTRCGWCVHKTYYATGIPITQLI